MGVVGAGGAGGVGGADRAIYGAAQANAKLGVVAEIAIVLACVELKVERRITRCTVR